jgi:hypothetical protein
MSPAYPKTESESDKAATARYHAMNNLFFLETAMHRKYPNAFVGEIPSDAMGFRAGDEKIMQVPLDWIGFHMTLSSRQPCRAWRTLNERVDFRGCSHPQPKLLHRSAHSSKHN